MTLTTPATYNRLSLNTKQGDVAGRVARMKKAGKGKQRIRLLRWFRVSLKFPDFEPLFKREVMSSSCSAPFLDLGDRR